MTLTNDQLREIVRELITRPGHEKVRTKVYELLVTGLGASSSEVLFELPVPEVRGRLDALLGRTIFEFKRDLRVERGAAEEELTRYLSDRQQATGDHYVGIATDGRDFTPYELRRGRLAALPPFQPSREDPRALLDWLDGTVLLQPNLKPDPEVVQRELGRGSLAFAIARSGLSEIWAEVKDHPEARLKRQLWASLLAMVYGSDVDDDQLFFQHTYLTIVAKTMATQVLGVDIPAPAALLSGRPFQEAGITGAVESDFFDWVLLSGASGDLISRLARQVARFRLQDVQHDVLKGLYESLIDPEQRHFLGEYYTPDWLASWVCDRAIEHPLQQRVLDPACGSGTFLFHAVRRFLDAAETAELSNREAIARCLGQVLGIDVHPVAVLIARVTYLLAIGDDRLRDRPSMSVPVYLGDSLQWNTEGFITGRGVRIEVPEGPVLHFPFSVTGDPSRFDAVLETMLNLSEQGGGSEALDASLQREGIGDPQDTAVLAETYGHLRELRSAGRNHIWGYVTRNLVRPIWLSSQEQRADVVIGNPPWLSYRYMSRPMQERFRAECQARGLWAGGRVATHQDLSGFFFARCAELYLKEGGTIAFVMPYAALNRRQFQGFRTGWFGTGLGTRRQQAQATVRFTEAWAFDERVQPLFPVPSCVLIAQRVPAGPLPANVTAYTGALSKRDAATEEAVAALRRREAPWPSEAALTGGSPYRELFRQGATMVPRMLCVVEPAEAGRFGVNPATPLVQSRRNNMEKRPWKDLPPLRDTVEAQFLRPLYLGESVAPFRLLAPALSVIPYDETAGLMDSEAAQRSGYPHLARWMSSAEALWRAQGRGRMELRDRWDYNAGLRNQFPPAPLRVLYSKAGTLPAATVLKDTKAVVDHTLYWAPVKTIDEARYLEAVFNSETLRERISHLQARGQWGARHFDKLVFELPIPKFDASAELHRELAAAAQRAEEVAAGVQLREGIHFVGARRAIRAALREDGVTQRIDEMVRELLEG